MSDSDVEPAAAREADGDRNRGRYRTMEYDGEDGVVTIFQDVENDRAWVQSDTTIPVER